MAKTKKTKRDLQWAKAKHVCRLNMEDIRMAKELGMSPRGLIKNRPSPSQPWKLPVKEWIHELYEKRFGRRVISPEVNVESDEINQHERPFHSSLNHHRQKNYTFSQWSKMLDY